MISRAIQITPGSCMWNGTIFISTTRNKSLALPQIKLNVGEKVISLCDVVAALYFNKLPDFLKTIVKNTQLKIN